MIKNLRKTAMLLAAAALLIFTGCNNLVSGVISGDGLNGNGAGLLVSVSNVDDYARLLAPVKADGSYDQLDVDSAIIQGYVLEGSSLSGKSSSENSILNIKSFNFFKIIFISSSFFLNILKLLN